MDSAYDFSYTYYIFAHCSASGNQNAFVNSIGYCDMLESYMVAETNEEPAAYFNALHNAYLSTDDRGVRRYEDLVMSREIGYSNRPFAQIVEDMKYKIDAYCFRQNIPKEKCVKYYFARANRDGQVVKWDGETCLGIKY